MAMCRTTIRVVMVGKTGVGKSSLGSTLLGADTFKAQINVRNDEKCYQWEHGVRFQTELQVTDTPGVSDTDRSMEQIIRDIAKSIAVASPGPHVILLVIKSCNLTPEEYKAYLTMKALFGADFTRFVIVIITGAGDMVGNTPEARDQWFQTQLTTAPDTLKTVLREVGQRYFTISNTDPRPQRDMQARCLFDRIQALIGQNETGYFTHALFRNIHTMDQGQLTIMLRDASLAARGALLYTDLSKCSIM